jgi:hypothetical protein
VFAAGNEGIHRVHSGNPAFRYPSINSFMFDVPPRAIHADTVKAGSTSSIRAAASRASATRPRWAKADARWRWVGGKEGFRRRAFFPGDDGLIKTTKLNKGLRHPHIQEV